MDSGQVIVAFWLLVPVVAREARYGGLGGEDNAKQRDGVELPTDFGHGNVG